MGGYLATTSSTSLVDHKEEEKDALVRMLKEGQAVLQIHFTQHDERTGKSVEGSRLISGLQEGVEIDFQALKKNGPQFMEERYGLRKGSVVINSAYCRTTNSIQAI